MTTFDDVTASYAKILNLNQNKLILPIVFGSLLANRLESKPVWLIIVGPPSSGKTQIIKGLKEADETFYVSTMTPAAFASGFNSQESLLHKGDGKVWLFEDYDTIASLSKEARGTIMGYLRAIYDGHLVRYTGKGAITWPLDHETGKIGMIFGATVAGVERDAGMKASLGERFIYVRMGHHSSEFQRLVGDLLDADISQYDNDVEENQEIVADFLDNVDVSQKDLSLSPETKSTVAKAAILLAKVRSDVLRDTYSKEVVISPAFTQEAPMRLALQFSLVAKGMKALDLDEKIIRGAIRKLAFDGMPVNRWRLLALLKQGLNDTEILSIKTGLSRSTVNRELGDLRGLEIINDQNTIVDDDVDRAFAFILRSKK